MEGWLDDDYLVLFSEAEAPAQAERYGILSALPGYVLVGLRGWDEFIVLDDTGTMLSLPTLPLDEANATPFTLPPSFDLVADSRFSNKIKWYVKPLVFGGDVNDQNNLTWVSLAHHAELVVWWNAQYKLASSAQ
jgi:hypothetical protein